MNLSESPSPAFSSSTSESDGSDRNVKPEASPREPDGVDDCSRENSGQLQTKRVVHNQTTTTNIAHHVPTTKPTSTSYHGDNTDVRQTLSDKYYQRRRSHQTPGSYDRSPRGDLPLGYSKPKGFQALKGIFETESGEGIFSMQITRLTSELVLFVGNFHFNSFLLLNLYRTKLKSLVLFHREFVFVVRNIFFFVFVNCSMLDFACLQWILHPQTDHRIWAEDSLRLPLPCTSMKRKTNRENMSI